MAHEEEYCVKPVYDQDGVQSSSGIGLDGKEYPDPVPMAPPVGYNAPPDILTLIRSMVRSERYQREMDAAGLESFEEADDFELEDDPLDPLTPYEKVFEVPPAGEGRGGTNGGPPAGQQPTAPVVSSKPDVSPVPEGDKRPSSVSSQGTVRLEGTELTRE